MAGSFYSEAQRAEQARHGTTALADRLEAIIVQEQLDEAAQGFIGSRDYFFLSTVDAGGEPTVSYKAGAPGFVHVEDAGTLVFPSYDGNGMYLSLGNVAASGRIGLLFMDFETPHRVRVQARAEVVRDAETIARWPGAEAAVRARVTRAWVNCPRYIHRHERAQTSRYLPDAQGHAPLAGWKRIDAVQDVIRADERAQVAEAGGVVDPETYGQMVRNGQG